MPSYKNNLVFLIYRNMKYLKRFESLSKDEIQQHYIDGEFLEELYEYLCDMFPEYKKSTDMGLL